MTKAGKKSGNHEKRSHGPIAARRAAAAVCCGLAIMGSAAPASAGTVKYDLNGPAGIVHEHKEDGAVKVEEIGIDFDGLGKLTGWNTKRDGKGDAYKVGDEVEGDATLYAQYDDGTMLASDLTTIDGKTYFYRDGAPVTGMLPVDGKLMYFSPDDSGARAEDKWLSIDGKTYHADADGVLAGEGVSVISGKRYCFAADGALVTGLVKTDGKMYSFSGEEKGAQSGFAVTDAFIGIDGAQGYAGSDGALVRGYVQKGGKWYWFGGDCKSSAGWHKTANTEDKQWCNTTASGEVIAFSPTEPAQPDDQKPGADDNNQEGDQKPGDQGQKPGNDQGGATKGDGTDQKPGAGDKTDGDDKTGVADNQSSDKNQAGDKTDGSQGGSGSTGVQVVSDGSASGGQLPQTGAAAVGAGLVAAGAIAAVAAGGKLAWDRRRATDGDVAEDNED